MKVLVCPHNLNIGGTQLNSLDLAAAVRDRGHDVVLACRPGPLEDRIQELGLRHIPADPSRDRSVVGRAPSVLVDIARREAVDIVHAWEDVRTRQALFGPYLRHGIPLVSSIMSMGIPRYVPRTIPLIVGTREILEGARRRQRNFVELMEPPVDTLADRPGLDDSDFRRRFGLTHERANVVTVTRLSHTLKLEGLLAAIDVVTRLAPEVPVRLVIVGDGPARALVADRARAAEVRSGRSDVVFTGAMLDPRPAYASADVVVGMGSSALRGMAFAKPVIVLGEEGFCEIVEPETLNHFTEHGLYGLGTGAADLPVALEARLRQLLPDPARMQALGRFSRDLVCERYSLDRAAEALVAIYERALTAVPSRRRRFADAVRTTGLTFAMGWRSSEIGRHNRRPMREEDSATAGR